MFIDRFCNTNKDVHDVRHDMAPRGQNCDGGCIRDDVEKEIFVRMCVLRRQTNGFNELMMFLVVPFVKEWEMKDSVCPIQEKIFHNDSKENMAKDLVPNDIK